MSRKNQTWSTGSAQPGYMDRFKLGSDPSTRAAYSNLYDVLSSRGSVDPYIYNRNMASTARDLQMARDAAAGAAAGRGLSGAGTTGAVDASLLSRGIQTQADIRAKYASDQAERERQDLALYQAMIMQPAQFLKEIQLRRRLGNQQLEASGRGGQGTNWGGLLQGLGSVLQGAGAWKAASK